MSENLEEARRKVLFEQTVCSVCDTEFEDADQLIDHITLNHSELGDLLKNMDIPELRRNDIQWIKRNLPFNNSNHPDFAQAWKLLGMDNIS